MKNSLKSQLHFKFKFFIRKVSHFRKIQLFLAQSNIPSESYSYFVEILLGTIRAEIGSCLEKAYSTINVTEAQRMLYFKTAKELQVSNVKYIFINSGKFFIFQFFMECLQIDDQQFVGYTFYVFIKWFPFKFFLYRKTFHPCILLDSQTKKPK